MKVPLNELNITLRLMRDTQNLSQAEVAKLSDVRQASVSFVENNKGDSAIGTIEKIAKALGYETYIQFEKIKVKPEPKINQNEDFKSTAA